MAFVATPKQLSCIKLPSIFLVRRQKGKDWIMWFHFLPLTCKNRSRKPWHHHLEKSEGVFLGGIENTIKLLNGVKMSTGESHNVFVNHLISFLPRKSLMFSGELSARREKSQVRNIYDFWVKMSFWWVFKNITSM